MTVDFLKKILLLDAATCTGLFLAAILFSSPIAAALGLTPAYLIAGGWICLGGAALMLFAAIRPAARPVWLVVFLNIDWVIASIIVFEIEFASLTMLGKAIILGQALGAFGFIIPEFQGARMLGRQAKTVTA